MSEIEATPPDWKLQLRYGKLKTPFKHFTAVAEGLMKNERNEFRCPVGSAWMGIKTWASDADESADMIRVIGDQIGFEVSGDIRIYDTEPLQPPRDNPFGYDINFTPFQKEDA